MSAGMNLCFPLSIQSSTQHCLQLQKLLYSIPSFCTSIWLSKFTAVLNHVNPTVGHTMVSICPRINPTLYSEQPAKIRLLYNQFTMYSGVDLGKLHRT